MAAVCGWRAGLEPAAFYCDFPILDGVEIDAAAGQQLLEFVKSGGVILNFADGVNGSKLANGVVLGEVEQNGTGQFSIVRWEENIGPLAKANSGESLPLKHLKIFKRQLSLEVGQSLIFFDDGSGLLRRYNLGRGQFYYFGTSIAKEWSNLAEGSILVPMLHRLQKEGSARLSKVHNSICGDLKAINGGELLSHDNKMNGQAGLFSGVFRRGEELVVLNRPENEDSSIMVAKEELQQLFGKVSLNLRDAVQREDGQIKSKIWTPIIVVLMLIFLLEGWLTKRPKIEAEPVGKRGLL